MLDRVLWRCVGGGIVFGVEFAVRLGLDVNCVGISSASICETLC